MQYIYGNVCLIPCPVSCRLDNVDVYSFDFKLDHIAKHLHLPAAPRLGPAAMELPPEERLPPVLVVNLQLPTYPVSPGHHRCFQNNQNIYPHASAVLFLHVSRLICCGACLQSRCCQHLWALSLSKSFCALCGLFVRGMSFSTGVRWFLGPSTYISCTAVLPKQTVFFCKTGVSRCRV